MKFSPIVDPDHLYFATSSVAGHKWIFLDETLAWIVLNSWRWLRENNRIRLYAFVVMPSHVHFVFQPIPPYDVNQVIAAFSSYTAHELLNIYRQRDDNAALRYFAGQAASTVDRKYRFWDKPYVENIFSPDVLIEKVEYTHNNPMNKGWSLVTDRADYRFSSACFYDRGQEPLIPVDDVRLLLV